jgi:hypothetical protein
MAEDWALLSHIRDLLFGELVWDAENHNWRGQVGFLGQTVPLCLDPTLLKPTREDQLTIIQLCRATFLALPGAEPGLRRASATQILEAAGEQASEADAQQMLSELDAFITALKPEEVALRGCGQITYRDTSGRFFPDCSITIRFEEDLSFGESEIDF